MHSRVLHRNHEPAEPDTPDAAEIEKESAAAATLYDWDVYRKKAGLETHLIAALILVLPKVGPAGDGQRERPHARCRGRLHAQHGRGHFSMRARLARFTPEAAAVAFWPRLAARAPRWSRSIRSIPCRIATLTPDRW